MIRAALLLLALLFVINSIKGFEGVYLPAFFLFISILSFLPFCEFFEKDKIKKKSFLTISMIFISINIVLTYLCMNDFLTKKFPIENYPSIFVIDYYGILFIPAILFLNIKLKENIRYSIVLVGFIGIIILFIEDVIIKKNFFLPYVFVFAGFILSLINIKKQEKEKPGESQ
jgi:hypothetical protein